MDMRSSMRPRVGVGREEHEAFFRELLGDVEEPTAPFGLVDPPADPNGIAQACLELDQNLTGRLRASADRLNISAASLFHVAWAQVLAKVSGGEDVVFGTVLSGCTLAAADSDKETGLFTHTLP